MLKITSFLALQADDRLSTLLGTEVSAVVSQWSHEQFFYCLMHKAVPTRELLIEFNDRGQQMRAITLQHLSPERQPLSLTPLVLLQTIAGGITVYRDEWDYANELLVSFSAFYDIAHKFNNYESHLYSMVAQKHSCTMVRLSFFVQLMNLEAVTALQTPPALVTRCLAETGAETCAVICGAIGAFQGYALNSPKEAILLMLKQMTLSNYAKVLDKHYAQTGSIPGFQAEPDRYMMLAYQVVQPLASQEAHLTVLMQIVRHVALDLEKRYGLYPQADLYIVLGLLGLEVSQEKYVFFSLFSQLTGWIGHLLEARGSTVPLHSQIVFTSEEI